MKIPTEPYPKKPFKIVISKHSEKLAKKHGYKYQVWPDLPLQQPVK